MQLILFNRDDSASPTYERENYHRFDVVDILDADVEPGSSVTLPDFLIVECDCSREDVAHLKEPEMAFIYDPPREQKKRRFSLDMLPTPYRENLLEHGVWSVPLGVLIANQRVK